MNTRFLGLFFIASTALLYTNLRLWGQPTNSNPDALMSIVYLIWALSGIGAVLSLIRLNALGNNAIARAFGFLPMIGFASLMLTDLLRLLGIIPVDGSLYSTLVAIGWIGVLLGMLVVGILTIAAKTWSGWQRFAPLFTVAMMPIAFGIGALAGDQQIGWVFSNLGYFILGLAIVTADPVSVTRERAAA